LSRTLKARYFTELGHNRHGAGLGDSAQTLQRLDRRPVKD
jgi:hypothetical protein